MQTVPSGSNTCKVLQYSLNQETYLRVFLDNSDLPMDNNTAERAIRPFIVGRINWINVDSIRGAEVSAIMYSLIETAKANEPRVYDYLEYVLTELAAHQDDTDRAFLVDLLPWFKTVQKKYRAVKKNNLTVKDQIYIGITSKMAVSFILWYSCLSIPTQYHFPILWNENNALLAFPSTM